MSAKWLITDGYGLSPGSPKYIVTMGLVPDGVAPPVNLAVESRAWVGVGVACMIFIMVYLHGPK